MSDFVIKQQHFWAKMDDPSFWEVIKPTTYVRTSCNTITHCEKVCRVLIRDDTIEVLWDHTKRCVLIQDSTNWYHLTHRSITDLTVRQVIIGLGFNYMETCWSSNGNDVLDILVQNAPLSTIRILTLDDMDICEKL